MYGLSINLHHWNHLIHGVDFDCATDHLAAVQIMKGKDEPKGRLKNILLKLLDYTFRLYYVKGKDLILADYFSRVPADKHKVNEVMPISFINLMQPEDLTLFGMTTRRKAASQGISVPDIHGAKKCLDPHVKPEHQKHYPSVQKKAPKQVRFKEPWNAPDKINQKSDDRLKPTLRKQYLPQNRLPPPYMPNEVPLPPIPPITNIPAPPLKNMDAPPPYPAHIPPFLRPAPPPYQPKAVCDIDASYDPLMDTDSPFDDALVEIEYRRPNEDDFKIPPSLEKQIEQGKLAKNDLPRQADIDRIMRRIDRKVLKDTHLHITIRDMIAAYLESPHFRDIYIYLAQNRTPKNRKQAKRVISSAKDYILLDGLLHKIIPERNEDDPSTVLCIPSSKVDILLDSYHASLMGAHSGVTKYYLMISKRYFCPNLSNHIRAYITGCHLCQLLKAGPRFDRPHQKRININVPALSKVSMDIKYMPATTTTKGSPWKFLLVLLCEVSNFVVLAPMKMTTSPEVCKTIHDEFISRYGAPDCIICDQDPAFTSKLMTYFVRQLGIRLYTVSVSNHKSLLAEHGIKSLSDIVRYLMFHSDGPWVDSVLDAMRMYNGFASPNLDGLSPYELVFGRKAKIMPMLEITVDVPNAGTHKQYLSKLQKRLTTMRTRLQQFRDKRQEVLNKDKELHGFTIGEIVYLHQPSSAILRAGSRKIRCKFVGPLVIYKAISPTQFLIMSLTGEIYPRLIEETRMKPGVIRTTKGNVRTLAELKAVLRSGYKLRF